MKLRNKKTGKIAELHFIEDKEYHFTVSPEDPADMCIYKKLADITDEWEDYEEPKEYWWIDTGSIPMVRKSNNPILSTAEDIDKEIGNYFETEEEAKKAVEKLKAWKRLKDAGFKFKDFARVNDKASIIRATFDESWSNLYDDLELLFGGEE